MAPVVKMTEKTSPRIFIRFSSFKSRLENTNEHKTNGQYQQDGENNCVLVKTIQDNDHKAQVDSALNKARQLVKDRTVIKYKKKIPVYYPNKSPTKGTDFEDDINDEATEAFQPNLSDNDESADHPEFLVEDTDVMGVDETDVKFICTICGRRCRTKYGLDKHQVVHENGNICQVCGLECKTRRKFNFHMQSHSLIPHTCEICNKSFKHPKYLSVHMQTHKTQLDFSCQLCTKKFRTRAALKKHERTTHSDKTPYYCGTCGRGFKSIEGLKKHILVHDRSTVYTCKYCSKEFSWKTSLTEHMRMHEGRGLHRCETCGKFFLRERLLQEHMLSHSGETPHQCEICGKKLKRAWNLKVHMRYHNNERAYNCEICGKAFFESGQLKKHLFVHNPELKPVKGAVEPVQGAVEKRHQCGECGKSFETPYKLKLHQRLHTGERPFSCLHCDKSFTNMGHLKRHVGKCHGTDKVKVDFFSLSPAKTFDVHHEYSLIPSESASNWDGKITDDTFIQLSKTALDSLEVHQPLYEVTSYNYVAEPFGQDLPILNENLHQSVTLNNFDKPLLPVDNVEKAVLFDKRDIRTGVKVVLKGLKEKETI